MPLQKGHRPGEHRAHDPEPEQDVADGVPVTERSVEHGPIEPRDADQPDVRHDAAEHGADRRRGNGVGIRGPEVERDDRALDEEAAEEEGHRDDDEAARRAVRERVPDLRQVEGAGARVDERDPDREEVAAEAVRDGEVDSALHRPEPLHLESGERVRRRSHQLEPDEENEKNGEGAPFQDSFDLHR